MVAGISQDLTGLVFGRLLVIDAGGVNASRRWICRCLCGSDKLTYVRTAQLTQGRTQSCGCLRAAANRTRLTKHGHNRKGQRTSEYSAWAHMLNRCTNKDDLRYADWGGRGITVDPRWKDFSVFFADVGPTPASNLSIERIDNSRGYEPGNVRWATPTEQSRNTRRNKMVTWNNETKCLAQWAEDLGVSYNMLNQRLHRGWSVERAFTEGVTA